MLTYRRGLLQSYIIGTNCCQPSTLLTARGLPVLSPMSVISYFRVSRMFTSAKMVSFEDTT